VRDEVSAWLGDEGAARRRRQDEETHRGRGPAAYVRSEARVKEDVCDLLSEDPILDASGIEVRVEGNEVTLDGRVRRREDKRRAEDLAERVYGVAHVQNNLRLEDDGSAGAARP
jgi:osmotically-inducible protein OsmY